ncbi:hypothetical protein [Zobellia alginiliquefaciens]|uniref:hypothetical protein n=1 Tax=Zobellia alginiliquefaciens TaxID=3032586 RepID=UPI0023E36F25|nr:hypothetical protein [Zobellia alginiliquefaciens]
MHLELPVTKNQKKVVFKEVTLPEGKGNLHAFLKTERLAKGPLFVDVERID